MGKHLFTKIIAQLSLLAVILKETSLTGDKWAIGYYENVEATAYIFLALSGALGALVLYYVPVQAARWFAHAKTIGNFHEMLSITNGGKLLSLILPKEKAENTQGDLVEEYNIFILPERGPKGANQWYWGQVLKSISPILWKHLWDLLSKAALLLRLFGG